MQTQGYSRVPITKRDGTVRAHVLVDDDMVDEVQRWCWQIDGWGYVRRNRYVAGTGGKYETLLLHRVVLGLERGDERVVDHVNRDTLDNRRSNLRIVTVAQNGQNVSAQRGSSSRFRGVSWDSRRKRWLAFACFGGKMHVVGYFHDEDEAGAAAVAWRRENMPYATD